MLTTDLIVFETLLGPNTSFLWARLSSQPLGQAPTAAHPSTARVSWIRNGACRFPRGAGVRGGALAKERGEKSAHSPAHCPYRVGLCAAAARTWPHPFPLSGEFVRWGYPQGARCSADGQLRKEEVMPWDNSPSTEKKQLRLGMWQRLVNHRGFAHHKWEWNTFNVAPCRKSSIKTRPKELGHRIRHLKGEGCPWRSIREERSILGASDPLVWGRPSYPLR